MVGPSLNRRVKKPGKSILQLIKSPFDKNILLVTLALTLFGFIMIYSSSSAAAFRDFGDKYYYLKNQFIWGVAGFAALIFFSYFDYHRLQKISPGILLIVVFFLVLVLIPGIGTKLLGARRWINLLGFSFQPAEAAKLASILYLSTILSKKPSLKIFLLVIGILGALMMLEPDLGTTVVTLASGFIVYFIAGAPLVHFLAIGPGAAAAAILVILGSSYRRSRLATFLNQQADPLGASYHVRQALLALGSGGLFGVGLGQSRQKYLFLPEVTTDSIFAVIGEELGLIGALAVVATFLYLTLRGLWIAKNAPDKEGMLLAAGIVSLLAFQAFINLAAMVALVPLTGIPLPLISYGGSSLIVSLAGIGILLNISRQVTTRK